MAKGKGLKGGLFGTTGAAAVARVAHHAKGKAAPAREEEWAVTTIRFTPAQLVALKEEALRRAGTAKVDASAVVRELVDAWLASRKAKG
jgi:hypothetical protein